MHYSMLSMLILGIWKCALQENNISYVYMIDFAKLLTIVITECRKDLVLQCPTLKRVGCHKTMKDLAGPDTSCTQNTNYRGGIIWNIWDCGKVVRVSVRQITGWCIIIFNSSAEFEVDIHNFTLIWYFLWCSLLCCVDASLQKVNLISFYSTSSVLC